MGNTFQHMLISGDKGLSANWQDFCQYCQARDQFFFITLISIDRMLGIKYPFGNHRLETKSACFCVTLAWLLALLISVIPISLAGDDGNFYSISEVCTGIPIVRRHLSTLMYKSTEIKTITISNSNEFQVN